MDRRFYRLRLNKNKVMVSGFHLYTYHTVLLVGYKTKLIIKKRFGNDQYNKNKLKCAYVFQLNYGQSLSEIKGIFYPR